MRVRDQKKLHKENKKSLDLCSVLIRLSSLVISQTEPERAISQGLKETRKIFNAKLCWMFLIEDGKIKLKSLGENKSRQNLIKSQLLPKLSPEILNRTYPVTCNRIGELYKTNRALYKFLDGKRIHKFMGVPLKKDGKLVGALNLARDAASPDFTPEDLKSLTFLGNMIVMTKLRRTEEDSKKSQDFLEAIIDNIPNPIFIKDRKHRYMVLNKVVTDLTGYSREKMLGKSDYDFFPKEQADFFWKKDEEMFRTGKVIDIPEEPITDKEGKIHYMHTKKAPLRDSSGRTTHLVGIIEDITERKRAESALRESEEKYRLLVENIKEGIYSTHKGVFTSVNESMSKMFGYSRKELIGMPSWNLAVPEIRNSVKDMFFEKAAKKDYSPIEVKCMRKDGSVFIAEVRLSDMSEKQRSLGIVSDITERKQAEEALKFFSHSVDSSVDGIALGSLEDRITYVNETFAKMFGYSREELIGKKIALIYAQDQIPKLEKALKATMEGSWRGELVGKKKDGKLFPVAISASRVLDDEGKVIAYMASHTDITERKRAEEKLKESEERYKRLVETTNDMIFTVDLKGNFLFANKALKKNLAYSDQEIRKINGFELVHPEDLKTVRKQFAQLIEGRSVDNMEYRYKTKDGTYISILNNASPIFDPQGNVVAAFGIARNITERKRAEETLIRNERIARERARLLTDLRNLDRIDDILTRVCQAARDSGLFERAVMTLHDQVRQIVHLGQVGLPPEVVKRARQAAPIDQKMRARVTSKKFRISDSFFIPAEVGVDFSKTGRHVPQKRRKSVDGDWQPGDELFVPLRDFSGKIMGYLSVDTPADGCRPDIKTIEALEMLVEAAAARVREVEAHEALQRSEKKYRTLVETAQEGIGIVDQKENLIFVNQAFADLLGYQREKLLGKNLKEISDKTQYSIFRRETEKRKKGEFSKYEAKLLTKSGKPKYFYISTALLLDEDRSFMGTLAVLSDLTEIKKAREYNVLLDTSRELSRTLRLDQVLKIGAEKMIQVLNADRCAVLLTEDDTVGSMMAVQVYAQKAKVLAPPLKLKITKELFSSYKQSFLTQGYIQISDPRTDRLPELGRKILRKTGMISSLIIPMFLGKKMLGAFHVGMTKKSKIFSEEEVRLIRTMANQVAVALQNCRLMENLKKEHSRITEQAEVLKKQSREKDILLKVSRALSKTMDLDKLSKVASQVVGSAMGVERCAVTLATEDGNQLEIKGLFSKEQTDAHKLIGTKFLWDDIPAMSKAIKKGKPFAINDTSVFSSRSKIREYFLKVGIKSVLGAGMFFGRKLIGLLSITSVKEYRIFTQDEMKLVQTMANQIAVAIENARLLQVVKKHTQDLKDLSSQLMKVQEKERKKIAQELHDEVGQMLQSMKMNLDRVKRNLSSKPQRLEGIEDWLLDTEKLLADTIEEIRTLTFDIRPSMLDDFGLIPTLRWFIENYRKRSNIKVSLKAKDPKYRFPAEVEVTLYRIIQEALINVSKHAQATEASVLVSQRNSTVILSVRDNGVGFDAGKVLSAPRGMGLLNIKERVNLLGGSFEIISRPRKGTRVNINIPF